MENKTLVNSVLYAVALAMGVAIIVLSFLMDFSCEFNLRYFIVFLAIGVLCLALAGINNLKKQTN